MWLPYEYIQPLLCGKDFLNKATFINTTDDQDMVHQTNQSDEALDKEDQVSPVKRRNQ